MPVTSNDIVNQALQLIGDNQPLVVGNAPTFDASPAGKAAALLYVPTVQTVGRQFEWDFARSTIALTLSGNAAPYPWTVEYLYPTNGIEVWQLIPPVVADANNPMPSTWEVANAVVGSLQRKVIQTNLAGALCVYNNSPTEATWDPIFRETVVRLLASGMAMAIAGRPDTAQAMLETAGAFSTLAQTRDS